MVLSPLAETMYLSSKSTTFTAARCPTNTLLKLISVGLTMSHTWKVKTCDLVPMRRSRRSVYYFRLPLMLGFYRNAPVLAAGDHHPVAELGILQKKQSMHNLIYAQRWDLGCYNRWNLPTLKLKLRWRTASQWWIKVFTISPLSTSHTRTVLSEEPEMITWSK